MSSNNLTDRFFNTINKNKLLTILAALLVVQQLYIAYKNYSIDDLQIQNEALRTDIEDIQDQLAELEDGASNIKMFQSEMVKILKSIHHSYPMKFVSDRNENAGRNKKLSLKEQIKNAYQSLFKLSSSQKDLHKENANLLASAVFIRRMLTKTPSLTPVSDGQISSGFGLRTDPINKSRKRKHQGLDIAAPIGTPVFASADGIVKKAEYNRDFGWFVELEHSDGFITRYGHLSKKPFVSAGKKVKRGQEIASVGNTGKRCTGAHLHYEVRHFGKNVDPKPFLISSPSQFF